MSAKKPSNGSVYVLRSVSGAYKIGITKTPDDRLRTFNVKLPFEVEYELLIPTNDMEGLETFFHGYFYAQHINGEWYALTEKDLSFIVGFAEGLRWIGGTI